MIIGKKFVMYANFTISVCAIAMTPPGFHPYTTGFVFDVVTNAGRECTYVINELFCMHYIIVFAEL